ncbi:DUF4124 domain-containing protein [Shewanella litorisediminis]|uniref:DUF4124 domain-containing protein n=1 Tax=Shewanella litorisediminis TaxID=1173586 RepID=A0ABX7G5B5_9GAMM|nr:DUF4124 domain-containing protein [Shewanella litorisediminis]MCL2918028.1 DUF4124 domain-containing protein [Shewanella litorisediminis]QRH02458.1 DUF4124 domain-containing protein [Shewanella litorisediminis]
MKLHITPLGMLVGLSLVQPALADNVYKWVDKDGKVHFGDPPRRMKPRSLGLPTSQLP